MDNYKKKDAKERQQRKVFCNCISSNRILTLTKQTKSLFWPTFTCQILIEFSFLESLWHKETDCTSFAEKKLQIFCKQPVKGNLHIFSFSWLKIRLFKILPKFLHIWNGMFKGFSKMYNLSFFGQIFFLQTFLLYNWILR